MPDCSILIPAHNHASLTRQCVNRLLDLPTPDRPEIIVIDDGSTDLTAELLQSYGTQIRVVTQSGQRGFAAACNAGAAIASGNFLVFLNNDTLPQPGWLENLVEYAQAHPQAGMVGAKLLYPDDTIQHAGVVICQDHYPRHLYTGFPADHPAVSKSRPFQIVTAACALVRRQVFASLKGFDPLYTNGYEDVDFCLRLAAAGHEVHYCHSAVLYHLESATRGLEAAEENLRLYRERWLARVIPDEFRYYFDDGLIEVHHNPSYPLELKISPLLSTLQDPARAVQADHLLHLRARQSGQQRRALTELYVALAEWQLAHPEPGALRQEAQVSFAAPEDAPPSLPARPAVHTANVTDTMPRTLTTPLPATAPARLIAQGTIHPLRGGTDGPLYSILMPIKNGAERLSGLLPRVLAQQAAGHIEIIAVDSGSADNTIEVLNQYHATILAIAPEQFNHGLTRNLAANYAHGDIFVFLNQSALPVDEHWLEKLCAPLAHNPNLAGVCSRLVPHPNDDLLVSRDVLRDPNSAVESRDTRIADWDRYAALDPDPLRLFINFHSVSAALRPQVLERIPLPAVSLIGEDLSWAKQVLEAGYALRHEASSVVFHSHTYSPTELLQRNFDDAVLNQALVGRRIEAAQVMPGILAAVTDDWAYLEAVPALSPAEREKLRVQAVMRRTAQWVGQCFGGQLDALPSNAISYLALTESIKTQRGA